MSKPDPLHLADLLEAGDTYDCGPLVVYGWPVRASYEPTDDAAAELRRQHAELERLTAERDALASLVQEFVDFLEPMRFDRPKDDARAVDLDKKARAAPAQGKEHRNG